MILTSMYIRAFLQGLHAASTVLQGDELCYTKDTMDPLINSVPPDWLKKTEGSGKLSLEECIQEPWENTWGPEKPQTAGCNLDPSVDAKLIFSTLTDMKLSRSFPNMRGCLTLECNCVTPVDEKIHPSIMKRLDDLKFDGIALVEKELAAKKEEPLLSFSCTRDAHFLIYSDYSLVIVHRDPSHQQTSAGICVYSQMMQIICIPTDRNSLLRAVKGLNPAADTRKWIARSTDIQDKAVAVCMALNGRLGANSLLYVVGADAVKIIAGFLFECTKEEMKNIIGGRFGLNCATKFAVPPV